MCIVFLPPSLDASSMYGLLANTLNDQRTPVHDHVTFDFSTLGFIKPVGFTIFSNLIEFLKSHKVKISFQNHTKLREATRYLDDSGFFQRYLKEQVFENSSVRITTLPLKLLKHEETYAWIEYRLVPWLSGRLNMSTQSFQTIRMCLQELFNNINDHSQTAIGSIFVQYYPQKERINIALSDFGVGIPFNVYKKSSPKDDGLAILYATREGFTTQSRPGNRGAGLDIFLKTLDLNGGRAVIYSNRGALICFNKVRNPRQMPGYYPGTLFDISFRTDTIEDEIEEENFEWELQ